MRHEGWVFEMLKCVLLSNTKNLTAQVKRISENNEILPTFFQGKYASTAHSTASGERSDPHLAHPELGGESLPALRVVPRQPLVLQLVQEVLRRPQAAAAGRQTPRGGGVTSRVRWEKQGGVVRPPPGDEGGGSGDTPHHLAFFNVPKAVAVPTQLPIPVPVHNHTKSSKGEPSHSNNGSSPIPSPASSPLA